MGNVQLVIKIPEEKLNIIKDKMYCGIYDPDLYKAIVNGIPLDTHDEEVIKETVESICGKPPYTELLDKIRTEIIAIAINGQVDAHTSFIRTGEQVKQMALDVIDKYRTEGIEE